MSAGRYVLDACAVIAFLAGEEGADKVKHLLDLAAAGNADIHMHRINLLEVYYDTHKIGGQEAAEEIYQQLLDLPIVVNDTLDGMIFRKAGILKATFRISLADAIALALAANLEAPLVTSDHHEFDIIEQEEQIAFLWIR